MYRSSHPVYQGYWQQTHYNGYQPVTYPQHNYCDWNNFYNNGYYRKSVSSTSSSMDSLNDPYYYSHSATTMPQVHDYRQISSPEMTFFSHPGSPTYSPSQSPRYSPQPPNYSPSQSPCFSPQPSSYSPTPPLYSYMNSNSFYPVQPMTYTNTAPTSPNKSKNGSPKKGFYIGMKPSERLEWIRETFPKPPPPMKISSSASLETVPVKPLRRPRMSTLKKN